MMRYFIAVLFLSLVSCKEEKSLKTTISPLGYATIKTLLGIPTREVLQFSYPQNPGW